MKSIVASQAKPKEKKTKQIKGVFEKNGGLIYSILGFILLGQNIMAKEVGYPVQIYPPGGTGAVTYKGSSYGLDSPILVLKAQMSGAVAFKVTTDSIKADEQPYNSVCVPTPRKEVAFSYSKQDSFTQEIGNFFYETTVTITNTGSTGIKVTGPEFNFQLAKDESQSFGLTGDSAYVEPRVIKLWKTIQHGQVSCQSNFTTDDKKLNETIRVFEFEITEDKESTTTSTMPDPSTTTSDEGSTTTSTMPDTSATTFEEGSTTTSAVTDNNAP